MYPSLPPELFGGQPAVIIVIPAPQHACPWQQRQQATIEEVHRLASTACYAAVGDDIDDAAIARFTDHAYRKADEAVGPERRFSADWLSTARAVAEDMIP